MPLYLVRWPTLHASLVRARDEEELLDMLDEAADPGGCSYKVYRGPVWIDFALPFQIRDVTPDKQVPTTPSDFTVDPAPEFDGELDSSILDPDFPGTHSAYEMCQNILRFAFPALFNHMKAVEEASIHGDDTPPANERYPEALRAALVADLMPLVRDCQAWASLQGRDDVEAQMMKQARVTTMLPGLRRALEQTLEAAPARKAD